VDTGRTATVTHPPTDQPPCGVGRSGKHHAQPFWPGLPDYQISRLADYQISRLADYQISRLADYQISRLAAHPTRSFKYHPDSCDSRARYVPDPLRRDWLSPIGAWNSASSTTPIAYKSTCVRSRFYKEPERSHIVLLGLRFYQNLDIPSAGPSGPPVAAGRNDAAAPLRGPASSVRRPGCARPRNRHKRPTEWRPRRVRPEGGPLPMRGRWR